MKTFKKRGRKLMRTRNRDRINRSKNQQIVLAPLFLLVLIKWELSNLTAEDVLARLRLYIMKLTGNADFAVIDPTLVELQAKADELEVAIDAAKSGSHNLIEHRNIVQAEAEDMIRSLAWDIQKKSGGDEEKIHSTGFSTRTGKSPSAIPGQVINLQAKSTGEGKISLHWKKLPFALLYVVEITTQPASPPPPPPQNDSWDTAGKSFKTTIELSGLTPGTMYYFRVYAANQLGDGEKSEISNVRCM